MAIRHVYFDVNGTLFDPAAMAEPLGGGEEAASAVDGILGEAVQLAMVETVVGSYRDFSELLEAAARRRLGVEGRGERAGAVVDAARRMRPFDDAGEALDALRQAGIGAGVLTNSSTEAARSLLDGAGLSLAPVVGSDEARVFKPHGRLYERGVEAAGCAPAEVALVTAHGWDAIGAAHAGLRTAWISRKEGLPPQLEPAPELRAPSLAAAAREIAAR